MNDALTTSGSDHYARAMDAELVERFRQLADPVFIDPGVPTSEAEIVNAGGRVRIIRRTERDTVQWLLDMPSEDVDDDFLLLFRFLANNHKRLAALMAANAQPLKSVPSLSPTQDRGASLQESLPESNNQSETP